VNKIEQRQMVELHEAYGVAMVEINKLNNDNNKLRKRIKELEGEKP
jgi:hypothetical protein